MLAGDPEALLPPSPSGWQQPSWQLWGALIMLGPAPPHPWCASAVSQLTGSPASREHPRVVSDRPQARPCAGAPREGLGSEWAPPSGAAVREDRECWL